MYEHTMNNLVLKVKALSEVFFPEGYGGPCFCHKSVVPPELRISPSSHPTGAGVDSMTGSSMTV